jgi:nitroimidazol reductase NimA-like FMN-containing flavoprotein (pyridoxamine 5'-phosphate oxidase superfamily)
MEGFTITTMNLAQMDSFLEQPLHAIMGLNRLHDSPHLSPVWYIYQDDVFYISITVDTVKFRILQQDPRVTLCIDGGRADVRAVIVFGTARIIEKNDPFQEEMRWRIIRHYHEDEPSARAYAEQSSSWHSVLVIVTPQKVISQNFN